LANVAGIFMPIGSMYGIYGNIWGILMGSMLPYMAYMDPMGWEILLRIFNGFLKSVKRWDIILVGGLEHFSLFHTLGIIQPPTRISGIQWYSLVCCWNLDGTPPVLSATWEDLRGLAMRF